MSSKKDSNVHRQIIGMPTLDVESITRTTYEVIAEPYCRNTPSAGVREVIESSALQFASLLKPNSRLLIIGAGDGRDAELFISLGHKTVTIDYSFAMVKLARQRVPAAAAVLADFRWLPLHNSTFDGVWASACLYHVRKSSLSSVVSGILSILRTGGIFYFNLRKGFNEKLDPHPRSYPIGGPRFYAFYKQAEVLALISDFTILEFRGIDPVLGEDYFQLWTRKPGEVN